MSHFYWVSSAELSGRSTWLTIGDNVHLPLSSDAVEGPLFEAIAEHQINILGHFDLYALNEGAKHIDGLLKGILALTAVYELIEAAGDDDAFYEVEKSSVKTQIVESTSIAVAGPAQSTGRRTGPVSAGFILEIEESD